MTDAAAEERNSLARARCLLAKWEELCYEAMSVIHDDSLADEERSDYLCDLNAEIDAIKGQVERELEIAQRTHRGLRVEMGEQ